MMANDFGLDYERIRQGVTQHYPRAADLPLFLALISGSATGYELGASARVGDHQHFGRPG